MCIGTRSYSRRQNRINMRELNRCTFCHAINGDGHCFDFKAPSRAQIAKKTRELVAEGNNNVKNIWICHVSVPIGKQIHGLLILLHEFEVRDKKCLNLLTNVCKLRNSPLKFGWYQR